MELGHFRVRLAIWLVIRLASTVTRIHSSLPSRDLPHVFDLYGSFRLLSLRTTVVSLRCALHSERALPMPVERTKVRKLLHASTFSLCDFIIAATLRHRNVASLL